jgi:hypothetical protein
MAARASQRSAASQSSIGRIVLELKVGPKNPRNSEGAFVTLRDGRILFAYTKFIGDRTAPHSGEALRGRPASDEGSAVIAARFSSDEGRTWTTRDRVIVPNEGRLNVMSVSLLRLSDGRIALFYLRKNGPHDCRLWMRASKDEARTFSRATCCIPAPGYFVVNNDRVVAVRATHASPLQRERLIVPAAYHRLKRPSRHDKRVIDSACLAVYFLSDDLGKTWREGEHWRACPENCYSGLQEPGVVELGDCPAVGDCPRSVRRKPARLFSWARTTLGCQYGMHSDDGGETWSRPKPTAFKSPLSPMSVKRIPATGHLLAVWNDRSGRFKLPKPAEVTRERTPLVAAVSRDEGRTWTSHTLIERDHRMGFCYTAIHFTADDHVLLAYCAGGRTPPYILSHLRVRRIPAGALYGSGFSR